MQIKTDRNIQNMTEAIARYKQQIQILNIILPVAKQWAGKKINQRMVTAMNKAISEALPTDKDYQIASVRIDKEGDLFPYARMTIYDVRQPHNYGLLDIYWNNNAYSDQQRTPESEIINMISSKEKHITDIESAFNRLDECEAKYTTMIEAIREYNASIEGISYLLDVARYSEHGSR